jgi:DNA repair protein RadC
VPSSNTSANPGSRSTAEASQPTLCDHAPNDASASQNDAEVTLHGEPRTGFGSWRREGVSYFHRGASVAPCRPGSRLYIRTEHGFMEAKAEEIVSNAERLVTERFRRGAPVLDTPEMIRAFLMMQLAPLDVEVFSVILLDACRCLIDYVELSRGTITGTTVHAREVVKEALSQGAVSVIFVHNHPSGEVVPSLADEHITIQLKSALALFDIRVLDHLIVGASILSFSELGLL